MQELLGEPDIPDLYVDSVRIRSGVFGFVFELGMQGVPDTEASEPPPVRRLARVRMSPQHALILSRLLDRHVALYQEQVGKIAIPGAVFEQLGLDPE